MTEELAVIGVSDRNGTPLVAIAGEVDISNAARLAEVLSDVTPAPVNAIDLSEVTFIDSTGLNAIAQFGRRVLEDGNALYVVITRPGIGKLFQITALDKHFSVVSSLDDLP